MCLGFIVVDHPPYSPDLASLHFHVFTKLKEYLRGLHSESDDAVQTEERLWFRRVAMEAAQQIVESSHHFAG